MQTDQFELHARIEERHWWFVARRVIVRRLIEAMVPPRQGRLAVDVGCGTGANLAALADGYRCLGIDTSAEAIRLARRRFKGVEFVEGFAPDDVRDAIAGADLITLNDVLEHVPDDFELLSRLLAAARPGTHFLLTVPADMALWSPHDASFGHYRRYDRQRFRRLWAELPVSQLLASPFNSRLYPVVRAIRTLNRRWNRVGGEAGTDFRLPAAAVNAALARLFEGEGQVLLDALQGRRANTYRHGVSLVAILRRDYGTIVPRQRPADVAPDFYGPVTGEVSQSSEGLPPPLALAGTGR